MKLNGEAGTWISRGLTLSALIGIIGLLMSQSVKEGVQTKSIDVLEKKDIVIEEKIEQRDVKFDAFLIQQTELNTTTKLQQETLMKFLEAQIEFNGEIQKHIIKEDSE